MLTMDFDRLGIGPGAVVLDLGSGPGRHSFEAARRGATVVAADLLQDDLRRALGTLAAMATDGQIPAGAAFGGVRADALSLPFADSAFDHVLVSEVLEHIPDDEIAMRELARILRPGGTAAVSVPRWYPERVCWALSEEYHSNPGGHVRIYRGTELVDRLERSGLELTATRHAHALHAPYWWLKCAVGVGRDSAWPVRQYHRLLVWEIMRRPAALRLAERALNPVLGKSLVVYLRKPVAARVREARGAA